MQKLSQMLNDDVVWAETTDGGLLRQLFGYYPTLHDAVILEVEIDRASDRVAIIVDYNDMIGEDVTQHLSVRIRLEWHGVVSLEPFQLTPPKTFTKSTSGGKANGLLRRSKRVPERVEPLSAIRSKRSSFRSTQATTTSSRGLGTSRHLVMLES